MSGTTRRQAQPKQAWRCNRRSRVGTFDSEALGGFLRQAWRGAAFRHSRAPLRARHSRREDGRLDSSLEQVLRGFRARGSRGSDTAIDSGSAIDSSWVRRLTVAAGSGGADTVRRGHSHARGAAGRGGRGGGVSAPAAPHTADAAQRDVSGPSRRPSPRPSLCGGASGTVGAAGGGWGRTVETRRMPPRRGPAPPAR